MNTHPIEHEERCQTCGYVKGSYAKHVAECPNVYETDDILNTPDLAEYRTQTLLHIAQAVAAEFHRRNGQRVTNAEIHWKTLAPESQDMWREIALEAMIALDESG